MEMLEHREGAILVLEPVGRMDKKTSPDLQQRMVELLEEGNRHIVFDLTKTEHIGGAGLRVLLTLSKKLDSMDGGLALCSMSAQVRRAFDLAGFTNLLVIVPTREKALDALSGDQKVAQVFDLAGELLAKSDDRNDTDTD